MGGKDQAENQNTHGDSNHQPHARNTKLITQPYTAHGGSPTEDDGAHGAGVEEGPQASSGNAEVLSVLSLKLAPHAEANKGYEVEQNDSEIHDSPGLTGLGEW